MPVGAEVSGTVGFIPLGRDYTDRQERHMDRNYGQ